ncbi:HTH-type transcriptional regulator DmlR [Falsiruegeria litorea R37]|uniref:HTH-type transcriptional regulator DmlR n=1 Tax=Falsiruegeria litorea R37 TaxID=1200284 RepID=A0A1Y5RKE4_9RHOB|nr:LysR family transcriptional regulator [Falsiruegeria litorea]SLN19543.1 HTH-type transcriptional regulator DmlR [Falsiruegeria litorea R37]
MAKKSLVTRIGDADLRLLRIFKAVVDSGGLSAAETELNIGRSTISKHISDLETRLELVLCHRGPAGFSLTEEGARVLEAADDLLGAVTRFRVEVNEIKENLAGTVRVALFDLCASNPEAHVARSISKFNDIAPAVQVELSLEPPTVIESQVIEGQLDLGIVPLNRPSESLDYSPIYGEHMFMYCGVGHPFFESDQGSITLEDVRASNYVGISVNSPNLRIGQQLKLRRSAKVQSEHALTILIMSGSYIGFLPDHLAEPFQARGLMRAVMPDELHYRTQFAIITRKRPEPTRITQVLRETLIADHQQDGSLQT